MKRSALLAVIIASVGLGPRAASAEGMLDIYLGGSFTDDSVLDIRSTLISVAAPASWDDSVAGGVRGGFWFGGWAKWFGLALDLSYFGVEVDDVSGLPAGGLVTFHMVPLTPMVMVRIPLFAREGYPNGQLAPYAGVGPGLFTSVLTSNQGSGVEVGFDAGLDLRAGIALQLIRHLGLFVEYRRTDVDMKVTDSSGDSVRSSLKTDHINGGIALRF